VVARKPVRKRKPAKKKSGAAAKVAAVEKAFALLTKRFFGPDGKLKMPVG
jgi:hypothetical protein